MTRQNRDEMQDESTGQQLQSANCRYNARFFSNSCSSVKSRSTVARARLTKPLRRSASSSNSDNRHAPTPPHHPAARGGHSRRRRSHRGCRPPPSPTMARSQAMPSSSAFGRPSRMRGQSQHVDQVVIGGQRFTAPCRARRRRADRAAASERP